MAGTGARHGRRVAVTVRLDAEDVAALDRVRQATGRSRSDLLREAVSSTWRREEDANFSPLILPAAIDRMTAEEKAAWRARFTAATDRLHRGAEASGAADMTEEELAAFVRSELKAYRSERRGVSDLRDRPNAGRR